MLKILKYGTEEGRILMEDLSKLDTDPKELMGKYQELKEACEAHKGVGVSANQLGWRLNFFFVAPSAGLDRGSAGHVCVNPSWKPHPKGVQTSKVGEGCLSLPGKRYVVSRWTRILATWTTPSGQIRKDVSLNGLAAQVFQHEHDHLRGLTLEQTGSLIPSKK